MAAGGRRAARRAGGGRAMTGQPLLREVLDLPESVHAGDFKIDLTLGFADADARVEEYVVTDQLGAALREALGLVCAALRDGSSHAAYLHGSFGSGKSHFMTVLNAILNDRPAVHRKPALAPIVAEQAGWLRGKRFFTVPYHLVGAADLDSAILGGYVKAVREAYPEVAVPAVYRSDALLADARRERERVGDAAFAEWLGGGAPAEPDDLPVVDAVPAGWTAAELDQAFGAPPGDRVRDALVSALVSGPMSAYARAVSGDAGAFVPLENGLSVISRHAAEHLGCAGLVLFLDELILWLQANMANRTFVNTQVSTLVKLIESGDAGRPVPIVSFISRQRDLSKLVGADVAGADVRNLEAQVSYLSERFTVISLEDRNLPAIVKERVLKPRSAQAAATLDAAFAGVESTSPAVRDVLLDANGATGADWSDFRAVYPLSPALLNVLVALSGALQRERTGLKLIQDMLYRRRDDLVVGQLLPLGDLWDVLESGAGGAFTDRLKREAEAARRFHNRVAAHLLGKYGSADDPRYVADDRFVKTLLLAALTPDVPALTRLTGTRIAALNHGSVRSRTVPEGRLATNRLRELQAEFGELRGDGEDPVFTLHLSDLDVEPFLDAVSEQDSIGARRIWLRDQLWRELNVRDTGQFVCEREVVWRGTRRTAELVFANVRDRDELPDVQFAPAAPGQVRIVLDYPFDDPQRSPADDLNRVAALRQAGTEADTVVWLPHFLSQQKAGQLGRLLRIRYLLERDRLDDYASTLSSDDRMRVRHQLQAQRDTLTSQLTATLRQVYGIASADESAVGAQVGEEGHVHPLRPGHRPRLAGGAGFEHNLLTLADGLFDAMYPRHPDFDPAGNRRAVTTSELRTVLGWVNRAAEQRGRVEVDRAQLPLLRRIAHPLELGEVSDGPFNLSTEWRRRIDQQAAAHPDERGERGDYRVEDVRRWIADLGYTGLDRPVSSLVIATYALLADRAWLLNGGPLATAPDLERIGAGHTLRAQPLPSAAEFAAARERGGEIFGVHVPDVLVARTVARLAGEVRVKLGELKPAVDGLRAALRAHAGQLGLAAVPPPGGRVSASRDAADLADRLAAAVDSTELVRQLAATAGGSVSPRSLAATITSAPRTLAALESAEWSLLDAVRAVSERADELGARAAAVLSALAAAAEADELGEQLAPALDRARQQCVALLAGANSAPPPAAPRPGAAAVGTIAATHAGAPVTAVPSGDPRPVPRPTVGGTAVKRVRLSAMEAELDAALRAVGAEIRQQVGARPDGEVEISWHVVEPEDGTP
jgi:hypothetical protein